MNLFKNSSILSLLICVMVVAGTKPTYSSLFDVTTGTPPAGNTTSTSVSTTITQTPTSTPGPTNTQTLSIPAGPTSTQTQTNTPAPTSTNTPTTTLMPLPDVTLIFPIATGTQTPSQALFTQTPIGTPGMESGAKDESLPPRYTILSIIIIFLWILLAGYMVVFLKHFR